MFKLREAFAVGSCANGGGSRSSRGSKLAGNVNTSRPAKSKLAGNVNTSRQSRSKLAGNVNNSKFPTSRRRTSKLAGNV